jgi:hypothetical protein
MDKPVFILSTGRTGTQFFEDYINQTSGEAICRHEPWPSRRFKFLSNLYLNGKVGPSFVYRIYLKSRKRLFRLTGDKTFVESSNFIFGCMPALNESYADIRIIHIVRHPVTYVQSHLGKGFWRGHKRFFARHVPYWLEKITVTDRSDPIQLLAARWDYVNRQIESYSESNAYLRVRFEDLFSQNAEQASAQLNNIRKFCGLLPLKDSENEQWLKRPANYSRRKVTVDDAEAETILSYCSSLMKRYQYSDSPL